jgi:hypothetical protein
LNVRVECINKTLRQDLHRRISNIGGSQRGKRWKMSVDEAIAAIATGKHSFYVNTDSKVMWVIVAEHEGHKYLKTEADGLHPNNLLSLPECP